MEQIKKFLYTFESPKFVLFDDPRLGIPNRIIQSGILVYFMFVMIMYKEYEVKYVPKSHYQYYIDQGTMYDDQISSYNTELCANTIAGKFDYIEASCAVTPFWCENNIKCAMPTFNEVTTKFPSQAWIYSYLKSAHTLKDTCDVITNQTYCDTHLNNSTWAKLNLGTSLSTSLCQCLKVDNLFLNGIEGASLTLVHTYTVDEVHHSAVNIKTRIRPEGYAHIKGPHSKDFKVFNEGENIYLTMNDILSVTGLNSLDVANEKAMSLYPPTTYPDQIATYRMTGYEVNLDFNYIGSVGETIPDGSDVELILTVSGSGGYSSKGNQVSYKDDKHISSSTKRVEYYDDYYRGIRLNLNSGGQVGYFNVFNMIVVISSFTILLAISSSIVALAAFTLFGYKSKVYKGYGSSIVSVKRLHGKVAAQSLISSYIWNTWFSPNNRKERIGFYELVDSFMALGYAPEDCHRLSVAVLNHGASDETYDESNVSTPGDYNKYNRLDQVVEGVKNKTISMYDFCNLLGEEETSIEEAMGYLKGKNGEILIKNEETKIVVVEEEEDEWMSDI